MFGYNETTNEYTVALKVIYFIRYDLQHLISETQRLEKYELIQELARPVLNMMKKDKFLRKCEQLNCSSQHGIFIDN